MEGFPLIGGCFWVKWGGGVFDGEMRERGCLMSGAAARTGSYIIRIVVWCVDKCTKKGSHKNSPRAAPDDKQVTR